jgi:hypothetical protein
MSKHLARDQFPDDEGGVRGVVTTVILMALVGLAIFGVKEMKEGHLSAATSAFARSSLKQLAQAQADYAKAYGAYSPSLKELGPPPKGQDQSARTAGLIREDLAKGEFSGYRFEYTFSGKDAQGNPSGYRICARPTVQYMFEQPPNYSVDQTGTVRMTREDRCPGPDDPMVVF